MAAGAPEVKSPRLAILLLLGVAVFAGCNRAAPPSESDVIYGTVADQQLRLDVYRPKSPGLHPAVITIHGGAWRAGDKSKDAALASKLVDAGFVCFAINYRLAPRHPFPAQLEDCQQAVRWVRSHAAEYDVDPERIAAWGESAGGQLALMLGVSARVKAVVAYFSPADFRDSASWPLITRHYAKDFFGGAPSETTDLRTQASPAACVSPQSCPVLLVHGDRDHLVPVAQSRLMKAALDERGIENRLIIVPGAGHNLTSVPQQQVDQAYAESLQWLQAHLNR
ncbi:MAG: alpha/beta hydrolase fold domain-containing protein [Armatimonadota bacterium]